VTRSCLCAFFRAPLPVNNTVKMVIVLYLFIFLYFLVGLFNVVKIIACSVPLTLKSGNNITLS
jgi:hypothetical protein